MTPNEPRKAEATQEQLPCEAIVPVAPKVDHSRRRFTTAGVAASGVILTLASRSVMASDKCPQSPSGFASGNQSSYGPGTNCTYGRSPGYWKNKEGWPVSTETLFQAHFNCSYGSPYRGHKLLDILSPQQFDKDKIGMHLSAALLNAKKGWTPYLTESQIKAMFTEWQSTGGYTPSAGVKPWSAAEIVEYLKSTML